MNNAEFGITIQKLICDIYDIQPHPNAISQFEASYNSIYEKDANAIIKKIFSKLKCKPIECLTFTPSDKTKEKFSPHNFILSNGKTLSIRTNIKGDKIAPRVVGQAGIKTFNDHFSEIVGCEITDKNEIKDIVYKNIHKMLPIFVDYIFISDYTVWIQYYSDNDYYYNIFDYNSFVEIEYDRRNFSFTRDPLQWNESTTLKYLGLPLAEIQIHKNRTFKFRFVMSTLAAMLVNQIENTETLGISAEKAICDYFNLEVPHEYSGRYNLKRVSELLSVVHYAFLELPKAIKSTGAESGTRGENSKCSYDFLLEGNKTLSLKTNLGNKICPPEVGQPGAETCYYYFKDFIEEPVMTNDAFKKMILEKIDLVFPIYIGHLFDSDYLLWIYERKAQYYYKIYNSDYAKNIVWKKEYFSFTKTSVDEWNESNTVKYKGLSVGEFQVHKHRSCFKFRFNMENLEKIIDMQ